MEIEQFVAQSEGTWRSMRSGHSLAFQKFDQILSEIKIKILSLDNQEVLKFLYKYKHLQGEPTSPMLITWEAESEWTENLENERTNGSSLLIPLTVSNQKGVMIRSEGYTESNEVLSEYKVLNDGTLIINSNYSHTRTEERIWFISQNVRCRSSVIKSLESSAILQTSFASEIKRVNVSANQ